jgi:hypothetical protein
MKQGGLWVCVSKTVCGFLGMHVYQNLLPVHMGCVGPWSTGCKTMRFLLLQQKKKKTRLRLRYPTTCQQCLRCRVCPAHRVRYQVTSVSSCRAATQWPGSWSVSAFCVDLVSSCDSHCAHVTVG